MEAVWLATVALVPLALLPDEAVLVGAEAPKIFLLRSAAIVLGVLTLIRWWLGWVSAGAVGDVRGAVLRLASWARSSPARFVGFGALAVLLVTALGTALSPVPHVSTWGVDVGVDTTAFVNTAAFLVLFGVVATRLRGRPAIDRLLWAIVGSATAVALFGVGQALLGFADESDRRIGIAATLGNPVFAGSYFAITIPLTLGLVLSGSMKTAGFPAWAVGAAVLLPQIVAAGLTGTRGSLLGLLVGVSLVLGLLVWAGGRRAARTAALTLAPLAAVAVLGLVAGAIAPDDSDLSRTVNRYLRLPSQLDELTGTASIRTGIWERSVDVFLDPRWPDSDLYEELPALSVQPLRPLIGYGPEVFRYAYLQSDIANNAGLTLHAHSFVLHTAVELGLLGVAAYGGLAIAVAWLLVRLIRHARGRELTWATYVAIGLLGALASRMVEQVPGKAQASDLTLSWALAGLVVALVLLPRRGPPRRRSVETSSADKELSLGHVLPLVAVFVVSVVLWWQAVLSPLVSLTYASDALQAAARGEVAQSLASFESAINWSPGVAVNYIGLTSYLIQGIPPEELGFSGTRNVLAAADSAMIAVLERNPLDYRAWDFRHGIIEALVRGALVDNADLERIAEIQDQLVRLPARPSTSPER